MYYISGTSSVKSLSVLSHIIYINKYCSSLHRLGLLNVDTSYGMYGMGTNPYLLVLDPMRSLILYKDNDNRKGSILQ